MTKKNKKQRKQPTANRLRDFSMYVKLFSMKMARKAGSLYASALLFRFRPSDDRTFAAQFRIKQLQSIKTNDDDFQIPTL